MHRSTASALLLLSLAACQAQGEPTVTPADDTATPEVASSPTNPALGRWVAQSGSCAELDDVQFTSTEILVFNAGGAAQRMPVTYSDRDGNSVMVTVVSAGKQVVVTRTDADHLALATPDGKKGCVLVRR